MAVSILCHVEGWVVRKSPRCESCYWYEPGSEKEMEAPEPAYSCDPPARRLDSAPASTGDRVAPSGRDARRN